MTRPLLLDLFCGAGGAAMGYHRAGFDVVGVDIKPQPHYPFPYVQADALEYLATEQDDWYDAIHASPPCQAFTAYRRRRGVGESSPNLIPPTRSALQRSGKPYIIENVEGAKHELTGMMRLCGSSFGLDVQRHRLFETSAYFLSPPCNHSVWSPRFPGATDNPGLRRTVEIGVWRIPLKTQQEAIGIDWMSLDELSQAIPPAYTEYIGAQFIDVLNG